MEQENEEKKGAGNAMESSAAAKSSENEIPKSLKARSKIAKKWPINDLKAKKAKIAARAWSRFRKKKKRNLLDEKNDNNSIEGEGSKKLNSREENLNENLLKEKDPKTSQQCKKNQEEIGGLDKNHRKQRGEEEIGGADKNLWKQGGEQKIPGSDKSLKNQKEKEKQRDAGRSQEKEMRKDKLGGLIFMCSKKTKPDCFHYHVMGVSGSRKDLVLGIKPGLKLFLYDFDLKFMYGIYKASSSGGMKLEPKAFGGAFPAQVHFDVHRDCLPLPESIFRKAIEENYDEKHKFKIELTPRQVRKLSELFRPVAAHSTALPVLTTPVPKVQDREVHLGVRESNWEKFARDPYANASSRNCSGLSSERDRCITYGKGSSLREEVPNDLCMTEKEYRAPLNPFQRGHETGQDHLLRHPDPTYSDTIPVSREPVRADALRVTEREYQTYNVGSRHELPSRVSPVATTLDSYHREPYSTYYYGASSVDPYLPLPRREDITSGSYSAAGRRENYLVGTDPLRRGETDQADRLYSSYATSALSNYSRQHLYEGRKLDLVAAPVSSRIPKPNVGKPSVLGNSRNSTKKRKRKSVIESDESSEGVDVEVQEKDGKYSRRNFVHDACQQHRRSSRQRQNVLYSEKITDGDSFSSPKRSKGSKPDRSSGEELQEAGVRGGLSKDGTSSERELKQKASSIEESMPNKNSNTREHKAEGKEADISACDNGSTRNPAIIEYPDPDFNDFDKIREENCFAVNQTWAIYDPCDGMPRFYARIKKVFSPHFRLQITWLEPNPDDESEKAWCDVELPIGCGKFINGKTEDTEDRLMFSHQISSIRSVGRRSFLTYPKGGETWAIFSDWDIKWGRDPEKHGPPYQYEFVEVLTDFDENVGIGVAYLSKVNGFVSLFKQTAHHGVIPPAHMYRFSHQIPSYRMTGKEREEVPVGSFELDPASLPTCLNKLEDFQGKGQQLRRSSKQRQNVLYSEKITDGDSFSSPKSSKGSKPDRSSEEELQEAGVRGGLSKDGTSTERELKQKASSIEESMPNKKSNTSEQKAERKEADVSDYDDGSTLNSEIIEYPDPDFSDFDKVREENCFAVNQTWAIYDPCDGMPRFYARIKKVFSPHFRLQITWLEPNPDDESEKAWRDVELPIACGKFTNGKIEETEDRLMFSHQICWMNGGGRRSFLTYPKGGETWAIFSDWDIKWGRDPEKHGPPYQYEFVEVLTDFDENVGIGVAYLSKVNGFVSLFKQTAHHGVIPPAHMYRFSHQIPSYRMTGKEREDVPVGSFEFDPASLPTSLNKLEELSD
ncbi:uncharacterized protein LOC18043048 isoform X2 [Citrus clementina]|uniref:uncharacterized protein LOC18043048 isoform X2 n=1 Tax=Citrus clementina TaxID=85681 RepID=UPI000CED35F4|nr:uncharacterized protein LOC18043048 isoform X2 [Citrus x clementina]